jgi:hypothetical protein
MADSVLATVDKSKPYKGPESYQIEDADVFYGRDSEANQLIAKILSSRFTLVHAQSGAGKTSLLNARIIPGLEARGWAALRILPENDPVAAVRAATMRYVLPHPSAEQQAIKRAMEALITEGESVSLDELLRRYDELEVRNPRRRSLVRPIEIEIGANATAGQGIETINPYFCRLLGSNIEFHSFVEHLEAILQQDTTASVQPYLRESMPVAELLDLVSAASFLSGYNKLHNELNVPSRKLSVFFEHLVSVYGQMRTEFGLVLILDQFEELFTRFVDPGIIVRDLVSDLPNWELRWEFFEEMEELYAAKLDSSTQASTGDQNERKPALPICYVVSMRDEYIAQMGPIRRFVGSLDDCCYHLSLLEKEQAKLAVQEPASLFGYTYAKDCFTEIIEQLTKEDRYVEPAHLQLVCEKLWNEQGRALAAGNGGDGNNEIPIETFNRLEGTEGILKSFFKDFINELPANERQQTLELLEPLVTVSGTRNIIERDQLINAPFRDANLRQRLLAKLVNRTIVRTEARLGGYFVEITHEFLIGPILDAALEYNTPENNKFRWALRTLERLQGAPKRLYPMSVQEFGTLHNQRDSICWNSSAIELMLRAAISLDPEREVLSVWLDRLQESAQSDSVPSSKPDDALLVSEIFASDQSGVRGQQKTDLTLAELRKLNSTNRETITLTFQQLATILRSELSWAVDADRDDIRFWAERVTKDV